MCQYKEGDILVCCDGFNSNQLDDNNGRGTGYKVGRILKVNRISITDCYTVIWPEEHNTNGIYIQALRMATEEEIEAYNKGIRDIKKIKKQKYYEIF